MDLSLQTSPTVAVNSNRWRQRKKTREDAAKKKHDTAIDVIQSFAAGNAHKNIATGRTRNDIAHASRKPGLQSVPGLERFARTKKLG